MKRKRGKKTIDHTDDLVALTLCNLAETGVPEAVHCLRCWIASCDPNLSLIPENFQDPREFLIAFQAVSLLKKAPWGTSSPASRRAAAMETFIAAEEECKVTNTRLYRDLYYGSRLSNQLGARMERARQLVHRILGGFSWDKAVVLADFGPGASIGVKRRDSHSIKKIGHQRPTVTRRCLPLVHAYRQYAALPAELSQDCEVVSGSKWSCVPKDSKTDRSICIEPLWNMFFQKGIGGLIRARLRSSGVDLDHLADVNRRLAKRGSLDGTLATCDLSAASDTVSLALVEYLLPSDWLEAIAITRSEKVVVGSEELLLRKVSSMGNGFTFELESLIFLALAWSCCPPESRRLGVDVTSFGDDIIAPSGAMPAIYDILSYCGFTVNREKSFLSGSFRESCGGNFFGGADVTPVRIRKRITSIHHLYWYHNQLRRQWSKLCEDLLMEPPLAEVARYCRGLVPRRYRVPIPDGVGDDGVVSSFDEAVPRCRRAGGYVEGFVYRTYKLCARKNEELGGPGALWRFQWTRHKNPGADVEYLRNAGPLQARYCFSDGFSRTWPWLAPLY